jgi:hypothetical protein
MNTWAPRRTCSIPRFDREPVPDGTARHVTACRSATRGLKPQQIGRRERPRANRGQALRINVRHEQVINMTDDKIEAAGRQRYAAIRAF